MNEEELKEIMCEFWEVYAVVAPYEYLRKTLELYTEECLKKYLV